MTSLTALVRAVPDSFVAATTRDPRTIRLAKARRQHDRYVDALRTHGAEIVQLDADEAHPDCPFVEDQAVVVGDRALITRSGLPSRRGEADPVAAALEALGCACTRMAEPAMLDGGDVLQAGGVLYVGRSTRTNEAGMAALARTFERPVVPLGVDGLHLKSLCSAPDERLVLVAPGTVDPAVFTGCDVIVVPPDEVRAANVVGVGRAVLMPDGCPITRAELEARGRTVVALGTSEFAKADGALTCLSVLVPPRHQGREGRQPG